MNENLKKRIVGLLVLLLIALVIGPMIFTGEGQKELKFSKIDSQDNIKFKFIDKTKNIEEDVTNSINKLDIKEEKAVINDVNEIKNFDNDGKVNWVIRIGTFEKEENALNQLSDLKDIKYKSFILKMKKAEKLLYAVNVGPFFTAKEAKENFLNIIKNKKYSDSYIIQKKLLTNQFRNYFVRYLFANYIIYFYYIWFSERL